jgi:type II secretory ATPase GspE/PulE/Tfp pilus assembly ATPase PilB-like protein
MDLDRPTLAETLPGALAQRLVQRVCPLCKVGVDGDLTDIEVELAREYGVKPVLRRVG